MQISNTEEDQSTEEQEINPKAVMRQLNKIVAYTEDTRKMIRDLEKQVVDLNVQLQQAQGELKGVISKANAALAMRGHGATT